MLGVVEDVVDHRVLIHLPGVHDQHAVRDLGHRPEVVRHFDDPGSIFERNGRIGIAEATCQYGLGKRIEVAGVGAAPPPCDREECHADPATVHGRTLGTT
jgi:hypothetical protein